MVKRVKRVLRAKPVNKPITLMDRLDAMGSAIDSLRNEVADIDATYNADQAKLKDRLVALEAKVG